MTQSKPMATSKSPIASIGIMGPIAGLIATAGGWVFGADVFRPEDASLIVSLGEQLWYLGSTLFTALTAIYGRWRAKKQIKLRGAA